MLINELSLVTMKKTDDLTGGRWPHLVTAWWPKPAIDPNHATPLWDSQIWATQMDSTQGTLGGTGFPVDTTIQPALLPLDLRRNFEHQAWHQNGISKWYHKASILRPNTALPSPLTSISFTLLTHLCVSECVTRWQAVLKIEILFFF